MAVNKFFHDGNKTSIATERSLYSDLVKEAIQIFGHDCFYVNRTIISEDNCLLYTSPSPRDRG